MHQLNLN